MEMKGLSVKYVLSTGLLTQLVWQATLYWIRQQTGERWLGVTHMHEWVVYRNWDQRGASVLLGLFINGVASLEKLNVKVL